MLVHTKRVGDGYGDTRFLMMNRCHEIIDAIDAGVHKLTVSWATDSYFRISAFRLYAKNSKDSSKNYLSFRAASSCCACIILM